MREMQLTPRLAAVAERVPAGCRLADVGTDHARLPIWLLKQNRVASVIASDLRKGPLRQAAGNAEKYRVSDRLELRLCAGLDGVCAEEIEAVTICGMGGETIRTILENAPWTKEKTLILQPQSNLAVLRRFLQRSGYEIRREAVCEDREHLYVILTVTGGTMPELTPGEAHGGRRGDWEADPLRLRWLDVTIDKMERELGYLNVSVQEKDALRRADLSAAAEELKQAREELRHANGQ